MPGAIIVIDQPEGAGAGSPGVSRNDLWLGKPVYLSSSSPNSTYQWDLLAAPRGSGALISSAAASIATLTPDVAGSYRIQLITNGGGPGNVQILVVRVRFSSTGVLVGRGWALPAFGEQAGESNYDGNDRGWDEELEFVFAAVDEALTDLQVAFTDLQAAVAALEAAAGGYAPPAPLVGDVGKVLTATGAGAATWATPASGGGGAPTGAAGGDLGGSYPNPTVVSLDHVASNLLFAVTASSAQIDISSTVPAVPMYIGVSRATFLGVGRTGCPIELRGPVYVSDRVLHVNYVGGANVSPPTKITGLSINRGVASGEFYDAVGLYWTESGASFHLAYNDVADDETLSSYVALHAGTVFSYGSKLLPLPAKFTVSLIAGLQQTVSTTADVRGAAPFDPSSYFAGGAQATRTIKFSAVLACAVSGQTCTLELYNLTDGAVVATLTTTSTSPTAVSSSAITTLANSQKLYGARLKRTNGTTSDFVSCYGASIDVSFA